MTSYEENCSRSLRSGEKLVVWIDDNESCVEGRE